VDGLCITGTAAVDASLPRRAAGESARVCA
jgi:hypothetical protein